MITMGWRELFNFTSNKTRRVDAVMSSVRKAGEQQEIATNRLALTIERVMEAKTGQRRNDHEINDIFR